MAGKQNQLLQANCFLLKGTNIPFRYFGIYFQYFIYILEWIKLLEKNVV